VLKPVDIASLVMDVAKEYTGQIQKKDYTLMLELPSDSSLA